MKLINTEFILGATHQFQQYVYVFKGWLQTWLLLFFLVKGNFYHSSATLNVRGWTFKILLLN